METPIAVGMAGCTLSRGDEPTSRHSTAKEGRNMHLFHDANIMSRPSAGKQGRA
jgi:hypothetical protein